jgi:plastocyanin
MRRLAIGLVVVALLVACGGGGGSAQPAGSVKVTMTEWTFSPSTLSVPSGKVVFYVVNGGTISHDMVIRDASGNTVARSDLVSAGDSFVLTVPSLPTGAYTFICDQPGHEANGMKGNLTAT